MSVRFIREQRVGFQNVNKNLLGCAEVFSGVEGNQNVTGNGAGVQSVIAEFVLSRFMQNHDLINKADGFSGLNIVHNVAPHAGIPINARLKSGS